MHKGQSTKYESAGLRATVGAFLELSKARLSALVLATTAVGFVLAAGPDTGWGRLVWTLVGTALAACGANALNQCVEVRRDARMHRTRRRPLPCGRLTRRAAWLFALSTAIVGPLLLAASVNATAALLALLTVVIYVFAYTPLKLRSPFNTLVGAVCGAIPPMIGWAGAAGSLSMGAWLLAAILFVWQIPHFLALAWLYRDDYRRAGFRMLPVLDPNGRMTCRVIVLYSLTLLPVTLMLSITGMTGSVYAIGAVVLGAGLVALGLQLYRRRSASNARRLFLASVIYLPLLLGLMLLDRPGPRPAHLASARESGKNLVAANAQVPPLLGRGS